MKAKITMVCMLGTLMAGCSSGVSTPEDMVKQVVSAMNSGDSKALIALTPEAEMVDQLIKCDSTNPIKEEVNELVESLDKALKHMSDAGLSAELLSIDEIKSTSLQVGGTYRSCEILSDFEALRIRANLKVITEEKTRERTGKFDAIKYDGTYYLLEI